MVLPSNYVETQNRRPKLSKYNFAVESRSWVKFFNAVGASYMLDDTVTSAPTDKLAHDNEIAFILSNCVDSDWAHIIENESSGLTSWRALSSAFQGTTIENQIYAFKQFTSTPHDITLPITSFFTAVDNHAARLKKLGHEPSVFVHIGVLVGNCRIVRARQAAYALPGSPTVQQVKSAMKNAIVGEDEVDGEDVLVKSEDVDMARANAARSGSSAFRSFRSGGSSNGSRPPFGKIFRWCSAVANDACHRCGIQGHISNRCIFDMPQNIKDWVMEGAPRSSPDVGEEDVRAARVTSTEVDSDNENYLGEVIPSAAIARVDALSEKNRKSYGLVPDDDSVFSEGFAFIKNARGHIVKIPAQYAGGHEQVDPRKV